MQQNHYFVRKFEIFSASKGVLFYTPEISAHIHHPYLIEFLKEIKNNNINEIDELDLKKMLEKYNLTDTASLDYLVKELKFISIANSQQFNKLIVITDQFEIKKKLMHYFKNGHGLEVYSELDVGDIDENSLIVAMCHYYQPELFKKIYPIAFQKKAWLLTSYIANHFLVIDNIHHSQKGMPCHFCNLNRHWNIVTSTNQLRQSSWINFCKQAAIQESFSLPAMQLTTIEHGLILFWLTQTIKNFVGNFNPRLMINDVMKYSWINLVSGEMNQEQAVHWAFCQCLQGSCHE